MIVCIKCKIEKENYEFSKNQKKCKSCDKQYYENNKDKKLKYQKQYREDNREEILIKTRQFIHDNKEKIILERKVYQRENKEKIAAQRKAHYENNKEELLSKSMAYQQNNKEKISITQKQYRKDNKEEIAKYQNEYRKERRKNDPVFKLRGNISTLIRKALKSEGSSKNRESCEQFLPSTILEMKDYLESLFEDWMTWRNYGKYNNKTWDDNDKSTWTWNIDHIIPQSDLPYSEMTDENFKKTWELSNIRPYSAKQNVIDGTTRARHKKKLKK